MIDYASILNNYASTINSVMQGFSTLDSQVMGLIQGTEQSALTKAQHAYESAQGNIQGRLVASGLGNSTILSNQQQQALKAYAETVGGIENQYGQTLAQAKLQTDLPALTGRLSAAQAYANLGLQGATADAQNQLGYAQIAAQKQIAAYGHGGGGVMIDRPQGGGGGGSGGGGGYPRMAFGWDPAVTSAAGGEGGYFGSSGPVQSGVLRGSYGSAFDPYAMPQSGGGTAPAYYAEGQYA